MEFWNDKKLVSGIIFLLICTLTSALSGARVFEVWQSKLTNNLFIPSEVHDKIVILGYDEAALAARDNEIYFSDRENFAKAFANVLALNPKILGVDYVFPDPTAGIDDVNLRKILASVLATDEEGMLSRKAFEKEFLPYIKTPNPKDKALADVLSDKRVILGVSITDTGTIESGKVQSNMLVRSIDSIHNFAGNIAVGSIEIDENDEVARKYYTKLHMPDGTVLSNLAVKAAELYGSPHVEQIPPIDDNNRMYINYFGNPDAYRRMSLLDAYKGNLAKADIEGKIVLFGPTSRFFNDIEHTPISPKEQMVGVEIHANALQTILDGKFLTDANLFVKVGIIAIITFFAVATFMYSSIRVSLAVFLLIWVMYYFGNKLAFERGMILDQMYPYLAIALSLVCVYIYRFFTESKEKDFVRSAFGAYVSPEVLKQITDDPSKLKLGGEEKIVTVLFSDIKDSTTIGEKLSAHSLVALLNEYFSEMSDIVIKNGGTVDKFEGDAIMAVFGAPLSDPNHAALACRAAVEMQQKLFALREKWKSEGRPELHIRIGVNTGPVVAGNVGSKDRFDYTVMGDTVNLGSRLEQSNKQYGTEIMVGKNTFDAVQDGQFKNMFAFKFLDKITVKGKSEPTDVYELQSAST